MSHIPYYARADLATARQLGADHEKVLHVDRQPADLVVIDIDRAHTPLSWLISPLQRAEHAYLGRLVADPDWPDEEISAHRAELDAMPIEDALAAVLGWSGELVSTSAISVGGALFVPERVAVLSAALAAITEESLREELDFKALDVGLVPPDGWLDEGEEIFSEYVLPALERLQAFYSEAASAGQAVLILYG